VPKAELPVQLLRDDRVALSLIKREDAELIRIWRNQSEIRQWFGDTETISVEQQRAWYECYAARDDDLMFLVHRTFDHLAIGTVALSAIDLVNHRAQFGRLMIGEPQVRGYGFGLAVSLRACILGFEGLQLEEIELEVKADNLSARRIYDYLGFRVIDRPDTSPTDMLRMRLAAADLIRLPWRGRG
jgi:diamine N-acetyltransferase